MHFGTAPKAVADDAFTVRPGREPAPVQSDAHAVVSEHMTNIFFYGLFMDASLLSAKGLHPEVVGPAVLHDYRIHIGERATLLQSASRRAYGMVMALSDHEAHELYAEASVREYIPEHVQVELLNTGAVVGVACYNLPRDLGLAGTNPAYATKLSELVGALEFDSEYVREIAGFAEGS